MDLKNFENNLEDIKRWLKKEFSTIRTSAANPAILDSVKVESYGSFMPIAQVSNIAVEGPKSLFVTAYDSSIIKNIEKAIESADLGVSLGVSEKGVRVSFPDLTSERREMLIKLAKQKLEDARIKVRQERDEIWNFIQENQKNGVITEDHKFDLKEKMEDAVKKLNTSLEEFFKSKEEEIKK